jgi:hypothetical protein
MNEFDTEPEELFMIDRILDERIKHFVDWQPLINESMDVVKKTFKNLKRKQAYVKMYKLNSFKEDKTDLSGNITEGKIEYQIKLKSKKNRDVEKDIIVNIDIRAKKVVNPREFTYKDTSYPLENYYISNILEQ